MAVGNIHRSGGYFKGALEYALAEGKHKEEAKTKNPELVTRYNLFGKHSGAIAEEMRSIAANKSRVTKPVMHFSISFSPEDTTPEAVRQEFVQNVARELGIDAENHQVVIVKHNDKAHPHYHIVANRVGLDNTVLDSSFTKNRLEVALDKQEKLMHLDNEMADKRAFTFAPEQKDGYQFHKGIRGKEKKETKKVHLRKKQESIRARVNAVLLEKRPVSAEELRVELSKIGIDYRYSENQKGLSGGSFRSDGLAVKGTVLGLKANGLRNQFIKNHHARILESKTAERKIALSGIDKREESKGMAFLSAVGEDEPKTKVETGVKDQDSVEFKDKDQVEGEIEIKTEDELLEERAVILIETVEDIQKLSGGEASTTGTTAKDESTNNKENKPKLAMNEVNTTADSVGDVLLREQEERKRREAEEAELQKRKTAVKSRITERLKAISRKRIISTRDVDDILREEMKAFDPNKNVWSTLRDRFGKYYEDQLMQKAEALNKERKDKLQQEGAFIYDLLTHSLRDPQVKNIEELEKQLTPKGIHIQWDLGGDSREGRLLFIHGKTEMRAEEIGIDSGWIKQSLARNRKISWRGDTIRKRNQLKTIRNSLKKNLSTAKAKDDENIRLLREYKERMKKYQEAQQKEFQLNIFGVKPLWGKKKDYNDALEKEREENPCPERPMIDENIKEEIEKLSEAVKEADQKILELPPIEELEECVKTLMMRTDDDRLKEKLRLALSVEEETPVSILYRINDAVRKYIDRGDRWNLDDLEPVLYKIPVIAKRMDVWRREDLIKAILRKSEELQKLNPDYKGLSEENKRLLRRKDTPIETLSNLNGRLSNTIDDLILREEEKKEEVKQRRMGRRH